MEKLGGDLIKEYTEKLGLTKSYDIDGIKTAESTFDYPDSGVNLAWTGIGQYHDMLNPCSMMVYMGAIGNGGTAVMPRLVEPTSFWDELLGKVPKVGV